ncbi:MAG: alpha/beta hydrolase-fold protein [bacterium]|nr:alpha/beta hydrolase-fold protein [bacterium]
MHIPTDYHREKEYALVIMLHGYSDNPRLMEFYTGMSKKADKEGFIVVYPQGTNDDDDSKFSWNADFCCGGAKRQNIDDVAFISTLIDSVAEEHTIDLRRVYVAGFSNGGMLAHKLGTDLTSKIAAIADVSGTIGSNESELNKPTSTLPVLILHGTADVTIPFKGEVNKDGDDYTSTADAVAFWRSNNGCDTNVEDVLALYTKTIYQGCQNNDEVQLYAIKDGAHTWFGGKQDVIKNVFGNSISATDVIWKFFNSQVKP